MDNGSMSTMVMVGAIFLVLSIPISLISPIFTALFITVGMVLLMIGSGGSSNES